MNKVLVLGGVPKSLLNFRGPLLKALVADGHEVMAASAPATEKDVAALEAIGVKFIPLPINRAGLNPLADTRLCFSIARVLRKEKPDLFLAYTAKPVIFGGVAAQWVGNTRFFAMITGLGYSFNTETLKQKFLSNLVRWLYKFALRKASGVFFQNPDDEQVFRADNLIRRSAKLIRINGSGVDLDRFRATPIPTQPVFCLAARLIVDKGIREFCEAARLLKSKYPQARFLLAGQLDSNPKSIQQSELDRWISQGVIEFQGWAEDVRLLFTRNQVYVLPSYREGTPRSVLEAMAMGRPVITTDAPGCRETVVDGENGFLVSVRSVDALVEAMERFILDPSLAPSMGARSRQLAEEKYDVHKVNAVILEAMGLREKS
jgi:glycosyltransferase involved in cell wall biosynthesis